MFWARGIRVRFRVMDLGLGVQVLWFKMKDLSFRVSKVADRV